MFNSTTLEVAIGMAFVYLLISLFCTAIREGIAQLMRSRATNLEAGIRSLFTEALHKQAGVNGTGAVSFVDAIYRHGLVQSLYQSGEEVEEMAAKDIKTLPSYIPSRTFASALLDLVLPDLSPMGLAAPAPAAGVKEGELVSPVVMKTELAKILDQLNALPESKAKDAITTLVKQAGGDFAKTRKAFEGWYDDAMDRAAGWYKRKTQVVLFVLGLGIAVTLNVDSIAIARALWSTPAMRTYAVKLGEKYAEEHKSFSETDPGTAGDVTRQRQDKSVTDDLTQLQSLNLPIGWSRASAPWINFSQDPTWVAKGFWKRIPYVAANASWSGFLFALAGWLLTGVAVTFGAPFWFDTLNQFMVVRSTIKPREKSDVEASKDSQTKK